MTDNKRQPLRIAFIEQDVRIGGAEINLFCLLERLDRSRFDPVVVCPREGPLTEKLSELGIPWVLVRTPALMSVSLKIFGRKILNPAACIFDLVALRVTANHLSRFLKQHHIDLICAIGIFSHLYGAGAADMAGIPCVWHLQDIVNRRRGFGAFYTALRSAARRFHPTVISISNPVGDVLDGLNLNMTLVPNGVDPAEYDDETAGFRIRKELGIPENVPVIGIVGRITPWKGQLEFVRAARVVIQMHPDARFLIVGEAAAIDKSYADAVRSVSKRGNLKDKVLFTGFRDDIPGVMQALDVLVLNSQEPEPFGRVVIEAMAARKVVVATKHGGVVDIVEDNVTGLLVPPGDEAALAAAVSLILDNPDKRKAMGECGRKIVEERYSLDVFVDSISRVFENAVKPA